MGSRWSAVRGVSRRDALVRAGAAGLGATLAARGGTALAQDSTPDAAMAAHPIVGAWAAVTDTSDPDNSHSLFLFHSDGTYSEADADGTDGYGAWEATGA